MSYLNKQIATYLEDKDLKSHQRQTLEILKREAIPSGDILELGSANATMLIRMAELFPDKNIDGVEIAPSLHDIAVARTKDLPNIECICADIQNLIQQNNTRLLLLKAFIPFSMIQKSK